MGETRAEIEGGEERSGAERIRGVRVFVRKK
jgi:hypothetical protein